MKVLVTGGTGFIGQRLLGRLQAEGVQVRALVRTPPRRPVPGVVYVPGALENLEALREGLRGCEQVYHLAAMVSFDPRRLPDLLAVNRDGTRQLLLAAAQEGVKRTVVVSSAITLGLTERPVLLEETVSAPYHQSLGNPYMASKLACEAEARAAAARGQDVVLLNPTTVYGPGDYSLNSGTLIQRIYVSRQVPYPPGGANVVDVDDVVEGLVAGMSRGVAGQRYTLGGENLTFYQIFRTIASTLPRPPRLWPLPRAARWPLMGAVWGSQRLTGSRLMTPQIVGDTFRFKYVSSARAGRELGWTARTPFVETVRRALAFYLEEGLL